MTSEMELDLATCRLRASERARWPKWAAAIAGLLCCPVFLAYSLVAYGYYCGMALPLLALPLYGAMFFAGMTGALVWAVLNQIHQRRILHLGRLQAKAAIAHYGSFEAWSQSGNK